jgi:hypothetical protein
MTLYDVFQAIEKTPLGATLRESLWLFPVIEAVHLLALAIFGGALLILDLRLLGLGLNTFKTSSIERSARPWQIGSVVTLIVTGVLLGVSEAVKLYDKYAFWVKMTALLAALLFTFLVRNRFAVRDPKDGLAMKAVAIASLVVWFTVAAAGRWIGYS